MTRPLVVTGTDTDVGKTVFAAGLTLALRAWYWKPIQAGTDGGGDAAGVAALGVPQDRILPEAYRLGTPCSPHRAAERDGIAIDPERLARAPSGRVVIEGAGGALVPVTRSLLYADIFAQWGCPTVIVARTRLGTINHSLMTIEALRNRHVPIVGVAFVGGPEDDSERTICEMGAVKRLGRLPWLADLSPESLRDAFDDAFDPADFA